MVKQSSLHINVTIDHGVGRRMRRCNNATFIVGKIFPSVKHQ